MAGKTILMKCLSGTPAEAGVRGESAQDATLRESCLSGTPAEAGVRDLMQKLRLQI